MCVCVCIFFLVIQILSDAPVGETSMDWFNSVGFITFIYIYIYIYICVCVCTRVNVLNHTKEV